MTQAIHKSPAGTKLVWLSTRPKKKGWYMASVYRNPDCWRWWDGTQWSIDVFSHRSAKFAGQRAKKPSRKQLTIQYTTYYPANARVARPV